MLDSPQSRTFSPRKDTRVNKFVVICFCILVYAINVMADPPSDALTRATAKKESADASHPNGNDYAEGDKYDRKGRLKDASLWSYGCLQIGSTCVRDYNRWHKTHIVPKDCLGNRELSVKIYGDYIDHYATEQYLGHVPTDEDKARIWNGGPDGWRKDDTVDYWTGTETRKGVEQYLEDEQSS